MPSETQDRYKRVESQIRNAPNDTLHTFKPPIAALRRVSASECGDVESPSPLIHVGCVRVGGDSEHCKALYSVYRFRSHSGTYIIPDFLSSDDQRMLCYKCLSTYLSPPSRTNLSESMPSDDFGKVWMNSQVGSATATNSALFKKLRWATLGRHYDWGLREYIEQDAVVFPQELRQLADLALAAVNAADKPCPSLKMLGDAAILNLYRNGDRLRGHRDDAETNFTAPLVSISVGAPCLFLLGHLTRDVSPQPVLLRGGDCIVVSGPDRLVYHGVSRLLSFNPDAGSSIQCKNTQAQGLNLADVDAFDANWKGSRKDAGSSFGFLSEPAVELSDSLNTLLDCTRLNLSIRQV